MTTKARAHAEIVEILTDERYVVPPVPHEAPPATMAWLRANVARFSSGDVHARRRSAVVEHLVAVDPGRLRARSEACTQAMLDAAPRPAAEIAGAVPTIALAEELGIVASTDIVEVVARVAAAYLPRSRPEGMTAEPDADGAVARLVDAARRRVRRPGGRDDGGRDQRARAGGCSDPLADPARAAPRRRRGAARRPAPGGPSPRSPRGRDPPL